MKRVMFICSVGGHLTQMLSLKEIFSNYDYLLVTEKSKVTLDLANKYNTKYLLHGTRSYLFKYIFIFMFNFFKSIYLFAKYRPEVIVSTGTHTAVVMCYLGWLFRKKVIFFK